MIRDDTPPDFSRVEKSVRLGCRVAHAFSLFTEKAGLWWPADRRHTGDPASDVIVEPGGRFFERAGDGTEADLGAVVLYDPPHRLVLDFYLGTGPDAPTHVEITFEPDGDGTLVRVVHMPKPISADLWPDRAPQYGVSWEKVLAELQTAV